MPRNKVHPLDRKRVAQACSSCKRRKEKCDGEKPCRNCKMWKRERACQYLANPALKSGTPHEVRPLLQESNSPHNFNSDQILGLLDNDMDENSQFRTRQGSVSCTTSAPIPKISRMLIGSNGKFIYIGDSASLSFLQTIRRVVSDIVGSCDFTTDPLRHQMLEKAPAKRFLNQAEPHSALTTALSLMDQYILAVSGIIDLFDQSWLADQLPAWIADPSRGEQPNSPVIYLALSIGALSKSVNDADERLAEEYFGYGRHLAITNLMDEPSLLTVQAFLLISYYMVASCRRNGAFTNLGVAVRAAYALGIHRHEANIAFVRHEGISRERAWKSLRVCDLFLSASMGRPPATSEDTCNIPWAMLESSDKREDSTVKAQVASAIFRICHIFERVLTEVYSKRAVSLDLAASISQQHRDWTKELPNMLKIDGLSKSYLTNTTATCQKLGSSTVIMAYYYSIILLTRPFLTFYVSTRSKTSGAHHNDTTHVATVESYSDACVDSAIRGIEMAEGVVFDEKMPKRQPLIVNSVFISALCLGLSFFGDYDRRGWPLILTLNSAIAILKHLGRFNAASARYGEICTLLRDATYKYTRRRDEYLLQASSQVVQKIFGDVQDTGRSHITGTQQERAPHTTQGHEPRIRNQTSPDEDFVMTADTMLANTYDYNSILQESMITTSGLLAIDLENDSQFQYQNPFNANATPTFFGAQSTSDTNSYAFREHVPLFSIRNNLATGAYDNSREHIDMPNWAMHDTGGGINEHNLSQ